MLILALAPAALLPPPLTPAETLDLRCVAQLAIVANEQKRGAGWSDYGDVARDGARYAGVVGDAVMRSGGRSREKVRSAMIAAVAAVQKQGRIARAEVDRCLARARARAPEPPPPTLPRCAAIMSAAYDAVKAREGLTKGAKDLATLASVLTYRARQTLIAGGSSAAAADATVALERDRAARAGGAPEEELQACALLAQPDK